MSTDGDDFDKEAEREKLREKYEEDEKDRESTQRMSELLLQGATMTGKHCNNCGDPIFRYDGQEFCPTCQQEARGGQSGAKSAGSENADEAAEADVEGSAADSTDGATPANGANAERSDAASARSDDEPRVEINDVRVADEHADRSDLRGPPSQQDRSGGPRNAGRGRAGHTHESPGPTNAERSRGPESTPTAPEDLGAARASLVRTLNDLARRAEETDDVARTRELLAATREAAEALAALDRAGR